MIDEIPDRLEDDPHLIKLKSEEKEPVGDTIKGPFYHPADPELRDWIADGGNVGKALNGPLVVFDIDDPSLRDIVDRKLPPTFTVKSGGGGQHRYFHVPEWTENQKFKNDIGSVRSDHWQVAIPPSIHPNGNQYQVLEDRPIRSISKGDVESVTDQIPGGKAPTQAAGGGGGGGCVGASSPDSEDNQIPENYPNREVPIYRIRKWVESNNLAYKFERMVPNADSDTDRSAIDFLLCKCMTEGGFSVNSIVETMNEHRVEQSKWHDRGSDYRLQTVVNAIDETLKDVSEGYVDFSDTGDMGGNTSESRKTERNLGTGNPQNGGEQLDMVDDNVSTYVNNVNESEDRVVQAGIIEAENDGNTWEYCGILFGEHEEEKELGTVVNWEYNQYGSKNYNDIGDRDPDELRDAAKALNELADELE
jgi:hypothetical protein